MVLLGLELALEASGSKRLLEHVALSDDLELSRHTRTCMRRLLLINIDMYEQARAVEAAHGVFQFSSISKIAM